MRHKVAGYKLGRTTSHRRAMLRNMVTSIIMEERIETTVIKAKAVRPQVEKMITLGKKGDLAARRRAAAYLMTDEAVRKLFDTVAPRFGDRQGGYLRIVRTAWRKGDGAEKAFIELLGSEQVLDEKRQKRAEVRAKRAEENRKAMEDADTQAQAQKDSAAAEAEGQEKKVVHRGRKFSDRILSVSKMGSRILAPLLHSWKLHPSHSPREAGLAHLLEHFFHLSVLTEQVVDFLHAGAGAAGNAFAAAAVDGLVMVAFVSGHGIDDGFDAVDLLFVNFVGGFLQAGKRSDTGQHAHETLQRSHFANLTQLVAKIFERKAVASESFGSKVLRFFLIDLRLGFFDEREDVAHAENARDDAVGVEGFERVVFFD